MISLPYFNPLLSDSLLADLMANTRDAVVAVGRDGTVLAVNPRFLSLIGWAEEDQVRTLEQLVARWTKTASRPEAVNEYFASCLGEDPPQQVVELQPTAGQVVEALFRHFAHPQLGECRVWYFSEWRTSALAWVGHEIKNPLNAVLGFSELLAEALSSSTNSDAVLEPLRGLKVGAKHLQSVLGDLLDLSRLESGVVESHAEWTGLSRFLDDLADLFKIRFRRRGLEFVLEAPPRPGVEVLVDAGRLTQVLSNLLSNSLRFTKRGWVALRVKQTEDTWTFSVEDSGVGIPIDQQKTIFEPFVQSQGQNTRNLGGTGLGLAICRALAQAMGARLTLESEPGAGSRFTVTFDKLGSRVPRAAHGRSKEPPLETVLVADDERTTHLLIQRFLRGVPVTVLSAFDGVQAVELWKQHHPRVVLCDLRMPRLSGLEAARRIRALDPQGSTRLLAFSASRPSAAEVAEGRTVWMGFLEKPFDRDQLLKFLSKHLTFVDELSS